MVKVLIGKKGTGKTKMLIDMVNEAGANSKGNVVCIEKGNSLTFDIKPNVRLVSSDEYTIDRYNSLYGFLCGIMAGNYDCNEIFVDSVTRICQGTMAELADFIAFAETVTNEHSVTLVITVSAGIEEVPEDVKKFVINK